MHEHQLLEKIRSLLLQTPIAKVEQKVEQKEGEKENLGGAEKKRQTSAKLPEPYLLSELGEQTITSLKLEPGRLFVVISLPQRFVSRAAEIEAQVKAHLNHSLQNNPQDNPQDNLKELLAGRELAIVITSSLDTASTEKPKVAPPKVSARKGGIKNVKTILAVASGKGGVGKSTLAVNISIALAQMKSSAKGQTKTELKETEPQETEPQETALKVGLLDADLYGPSLVQMLALDKPPQRNSDSLIIPEQRFGIKTLSMGAMIKDAQALVWRGPLIGRALKQLLEGTDWGVLDILILDLPPGTGDLPLTLAQNASIDAAMLVSTPQQVALYDVRKSQNMFDKLRIPVVGIIENMSMFQCTHCGAESPIFGSGGSEQLAKKTKIPFLGRLPISQALQESGDKATPIMAIAHKNSEKNSQENLAVTTVERLAERAEAGEADELSSSLASSRNDSQASQKAYSLHIQELGENMRSIASKLLAQLETLQKNSGDAKMSLKVE